MDTKYILDIVKTVSLVIGGLWVIYNYAWKRERYPRTEFNLDIKLIDQHKNLLLLEFIANLENKGWVRHYIDVETFILKIRYITDDDEINNLIHLTFEDHDRKIIDVDFFISIFLMPLNPIPEARLSFGYQKNGSSSLLMLAQNKR